MRRRGPQIPLFNINDSLVRNITPREAYELEAGGSVTLSYTRNHGRQRELIGARLRVAIKPGQPGVATIRMSEAAANAGVYGKSRTVNMHELDKRQNTRKVKYASGVEVEVAELEDFVELAQGKVTLWALEHDTKAVRVGPMPDAAAMKLAQKLAVQSRLYPD